MKQKKSQIHQIKRIFKESERGREKKVPHSIHRYTKKHTHTENIRDGNPNIIHMKSNDSLTHTHMPHTIKRKTVLTTKSNVINFIFIIITLHICWRLTLSLHHSDTMMTTTKTTHIFAIVIFILNAFI